MSTTKLIHDGRAVENSWTETAEDQALPTHGRLVVSLERWRRERATLTEASFVVGVRLANTLDLTKVWPEIADRPLLVLEFPKSGDGRAYSQARLLRERYGYTGELRASGDVLRDQLQFMQRCGFNAYELRADQDLAECLAAFSDFPMAYQRATDAIPNVWEQRRRRKHAA